MKTPKPRREPTSAPKGEREIDLGFLDRHIAFNLRLAQDASFRYFARISGVPHLKPGRFALMLVIHNNPGMTQVELGRAIARDKSTVTPLVQELQRHGLVERQASEVDRRQITLRLTPAGEEALEGLRRHALEHDRALVRIVGEKKAEFVELLKKIANEL